MPVVCNAVVLPLVALGDLFVEVEHPVLADHLVVEGPEVVGLRVGLARAQNLLAAETLLQDQSGVGKLDLLWGIYEYKLRYDQRC